MQLLKDIHGIRVAECSSLYETEPVGEEYDKEWFVNAVAAIDTNMSAESLLEACMDVENRLAKLHASDSPSSKRSQGKRKRIIDLDILVFGDEICDSSNLHIPHPRMHKRAFALVPLLEIAPDLVHPTLKKTVTELHEDLVEPELVFLYGTRTEGR